MATLEEARQFLQKESADGVSLYDHLSSVLLKVLSERPADAAAVFEHLSAGIKKRGGVKAGLEARSKSQEAAKAQQLNWATATQALFAVPDDPPEGGPALPDIMDEANMWEWAGVSLGRLETYRLYLSVKLFAEGLSSDHESVRFWGRITTRKADYLIMEGKSTDEQLGEFDEASQEGRDGANRYCYWVSRGSSLPWEPLPPVTQAQILAARKIKRYMTGDLDAAVPGYPPFPGTERNLLRAQIARISSGASVSPAGFFELDGEAEPPVVKFAEPEAINENFPKAIDELTSPDGWVHHEMELNAKGRCRPLPEKLDDEGNPIEEEDPPEEVAPLRSLADDVEGTWGFRTCPSRPGQSANSMVVARNLLWPGAYAVAYGKRFTNIYMGDGVKYQPRPYQPPMPPAIQVEWAPPEGEDNPLVEQPDILKDPNPPPEEDGEEE